MASNNTKIGLSGSLATVTVLLIVYISLHPFADWQDTGVEAFAWLTAAWPQYWTFFDLIVNVIAYLPLGFCWMTVARSRFSIVPMLLLVVLGGSVLSLLMETVQNYLPSRVASNVDFGGNILGTLLGAILGIRLGPLILDGGKLYSLRHHYFASGLSGNSGLVLLGLWVLIQANPVNVLLVNGDLRQWLDIHGDWSFTAFQFHVLEAIVVGANTLAMIALASCLVLSSVRTLPLILVIIAISLKTITLAVSVGINTSMAWLTIGTMTGLIGSTLLWWGLLSLTMRTRQILCALLLFIATVMLNLSPENPYLVNTWQTWNPGQWLNFFGLTSLLASAWPFLALTWFMFVCYARRSR